MSDADTTGEAVQALRDARTVMGNDDMQRRKFFAQLFGSGSNVRLRDLVSALKISRDEVNRVASTIAGGPFELDEDQYRALGNLFFGDYYSPIQPIDGDQDAAFQEFYANLFANQNDVELTALRDLQRTVGDFWRTGKPDEPAILDRLSSLGPKVKWDARHIFAFISLLTIDISMKVLKPYEASGSIW